MLCVSSEVPCQVNNVGHLNHAKLMMSALQAPIMLITVGALRLLHVDRDVLSEKNGSPADCVY